MKALVIIHMKKGKMSRPLLLPDGDIAGVYRRKIGVSHDDLFKFVQGWVGDNGVMVAMMRDNEEVIVEAIGDGGTRSYLHDAGMQVFREMVEELAKPSFEPHRS